MQRDLSPVEVRALCALVEKELTTPDQYPLSTNALRSACNQKTSREPVMDLTEATIDATVLSLRERRLARSSKPQGSRAWKHRHVIAEVLPLDPAQIAVLAVLGLRGPQTSGEIRQRTDRMHPFDDTEQVDVVLWSLNDRDDPFVRNLGREAGQSQDRWVHTLSDAAVPLEASRQHHMASEFRALHESGFFMLPNPWDRGSARMMQELGAQALATTSAGHGSAIGKNDQEVTRDELVGHVADLVSFIDVPLNVDSEHLFPHDPGGIGRTVELLASAGAAGVSIEDYDPASGSIVSLGRATEAVAAAAAACGRHGIVLTARAENLLYELGDLDDTITRLQAFEEAGADVLYAPGVRTADDIELILSEVSLPINVLTMPGTPPIDELAVLGVRRASTGSNIYNVGAAAARAATAKYFAG